MSDYLSEGFPLYRVKNIQNCLIEDNDFVFIDKEKHSQLKRSEVLKDDVLITKAGRIGSSAVNKFERANITSHLCLIRTKDILDPYYLVAYLESSLGRLLSERLSHKSTRPELTKKEVEEIEILLPPRPIQESVSYTHLDVYKRQTLWSRQLRRFRSS